MKTSIIILTFNKLEYTKLCINSIRNFTLKDTYELIVIDNASTDGTIDWLKEQKDITTIFNNINLGFPKGCNQGIKVSTGDNILLLNNDTVVGFNWLDNMLKGLYSDDKIGAVGAVSNNCPNYQSISTNYNTIEEMFEFSKKYNISNPELWEQKIKLIGFCMLIKKNIIDEIGLLDEVFTPGNFEDDDYSFRIIKAGYKLLLCKDTFVHHYGSVSFNSNPGSFWNIFKINELRFKLKWGFASGYSSSIRFDLINLMSNEKDDPVDVLEIGCACGATLLKIKDIYKNSNLYGVEVNTNCAEIAKNFATIISENIENKVLPFEDNFFDYIILGDVLEHLVDPWSVLNNLRKHLKPSGWVIASIPNVMHFSVIRGLLNGSWTYTDAGLLDTTHLRFFTFAEIDKMFINAGYENMQYSANSLYKSKEDIEFTNILNAITNDIFANQYDNYQYFIKANKKF